MDRRKFLGNIGVLSGAAGLSRHSVLLGDRSGLSARLAALVANAGSNVGEAAGLPTAEWLKKENARKGTTTWVITPRHKRGDIEGYLNVTSAQRGEQFTLHVNTSAASWQAQVFRIGYYDGHGARLVHVTPKIPSQKQPTHTFTPGINMVECHWHPSRIFTVDEDWLPGFYLIKLAGSGGELRYVPFLVRDDSSKAAIVIQSSVATWQAYNQWGGYSLYGGIPTPGKDTYATRSRIVSFDRPYTPSPLALDANGSGDFLGNELPFVYLAERLGLDVTYWTDVDLHVRPSLLEHHRCLVTLGHAEYWSWQMREGATTALKNGTNLAFLGANACYRQIRFEKSAIGDNRRVICYKDASEDPVTRSNPMFATGSSWATDPVPKPESDLVGSMYQAYGANSPLVIADASSFVFSGTGLKNKDHVVATRKANVVGSEFDAFEPKLQPAGEVTILAHSPTTSVHGKGAADMTYFTMPNGGGVFATGTSRWVQLLWKGEKRVDNALSFGNSPAATTLTKITLNVLRVFASGPAAKTHPSVANWHQFYKTSAPVHLGVDVGGH